NTSRLDTFPPLPRLQMFDAQLGYYMPGRVGNPRSPAIFRMTDGGATREQITTPYTSEATAMWFLDEQTGWISGNNGTTVLQRIARTDNGGTSWTLQDTPPFPSGGQIHDIFFLDANHGWACGTYGVMLRTEDGGASWEQARVETRNALNAVRFADL